MKLSEAFHYRVLSKQCGVYPVARLLHKRGVPLSEALEILASGTAKYLPEGTYKLTAALNITGRT